MEEFLKGFELVRSAWEYLKDKPVLKITVNIFVVSFGLFMLCSLPILSSILGNMNETIRTISFLVVMISGLSVMSMWLVGRIFLEAERKKVEKELELRKKEEERKSESERERLIAELGALSRSERNILKLVQSGEGCAVWVSENDAGVQTLLHKGLLKQVGEVGSWQDWETGYDGRAWCILTELPLAVKSVLRK